MIDSDATDATDDTDGTYVGCPTIYRLQIKGFEEWGGKKGVINFWDEPNPSDVVWAVDLWLDGPGSNPAEIPKTLISEEGKLVDVFESTVRKAK